MQVLEKTTEDDLNTQITSLSTYGSTEDQLITSAHRTRHGYFRIYARLRSHWKIIIDRLITGAPGILYQKVRLLICTNENA